MASRFCSVRRGRKFFEANELDSAFMGNVLSLIGKLYDIERDAVQRNLSSQQRFDLRKERSGPVLEEIKCCLGNPNSLILPKSKIGEAVEYTLNHWEQLIRFLEDGRLPIDNNLVENVIRPVALGRKNWNFAGSPEGAKRLATFYSLVATCKLNDINPYEYFYDILPKVASYPANKIADLTPINWKKARK